MTEIQKIKEFCNKPSSLSVKLISKDKKSIIFPLGKDYDDLFDEWLTNGANEHTLEYWIKYWRTGIISEQDLKEQNTFVYGFLESLEQSNEWPSWLGDFSVEVVKNEE